jgi:hypothetical protein
VYPHERALEIAAAISDRYEGQLYRVGGRLVRIQGQDAAPLAKVEFQALASAAVYIRDRGGNYHPAPERTLREVYYFEALAASKEGIVRAPWMASDGTLYGRRREDHGEILSLYDSGPIPTGMTREEAEPVLERLLDYRWDSDEDRAGYLAALVQCVRQPCLWGEGAPLYLIQATDKDSGKTYAASVLSLLLTGKITNTLHLPTSQREREYSLSSFLQSGPSLVWLDNLATGSTAGGSDLHALLTARGGLASRVIGSNAMALVDPTRPLWVATGNQIDVDDELGRRIVSIKMSPRAAGSAYKTRDLLGWVRDNRALALGALFTVARTQPSAVRELRLSSYPTWGELVAAPVEAWTGAGRIGSEVASGIELELVRLCEEWPRSKGEPAPLTMAALLATVKARGMYRIMELTAGRSSKDAVLGRWVASIAARSRPIKGWRLIRRRGAKGVRVVLPSRDPAYIANDERQGGSVVTVAPSNRHPQSDGSTTGSDGCVGCDGQSPPSHVQFQQEPPPTTVTTATTIIGDSSNCNMQVTDGVHLEEQPSPRDLWGPWVLQMATRGIYVDAELWDARCTAARVELAKRAADSEADASRLRAFEAYAQPVLDQATAGDGRVRAEWVEQGPGRWGATNPPIQTVTRSYGLRDAFQAPTGRTLIVSDWSAAHMWIAAGLSGDPELTRELQDPDASPYRRLAVESGATLVQAKRGALAILNGAGVRKVASILGVKPRTAAAARTAWLRPYKTLRHRIGLWREERSWLSPEGRTIKLPAGAPRHVALAWRWQAAEADALGIALQLLEAQDIDVVLTVHDELICEVDEGAAPMALPLVQAAMAQALGQVCGLQGETKARATNTWGTEC